MKHPIVTGSLAFDHIMNLDTRFRDYIMPDKIHVLNVSFHANEMRKEMGGTAGNIAYNLGLLGFKPTLVAAAGSDFSEYKKRLTALDVDCSNVQIFKDELTSSGFVLTDPDDNQIWSFSFNAGNHTQELVLPKKQDPFLVIAPSGPEGIMNFVDQAQTRGYPYMFDPAFAIPELDKKDLVRGIKGATIVIGNDYEIELMKQKTKLTTQQLLEKNRILVTTKGVHGSQIQSANPEDIERHEAKGRKTKSSKYLTYTVPSARPQAVLDPTGAGDAYRAGFLAGYLKGLDLETCGRIGALTAANSIEHYGTTAHRFELDEFKARYQQNFDQELDL